MPFKHSKAFSLGEVLISLLILAQIATFTIPKILVAQQRQAWNASAREAVAAVSEAYQLHVSKNGYSINTGAASLTPYIHYVRLDTGFETFDGVPGSPDSQCWYSGGCMRLHNGAVLQDGGTSFGASNTTNYIHFIFDPDGKASGSPTGPGKAITIVLYYNGRVTTGDNRNASDITYWGGVPVSLGIDPKPDWFNW